MIQNRVRSSLHDKRVIVLDRQVEGRLTPQLGGIGVNPRALQKQLKHLMEVMSRHTSGGRESRDGGGARGRSGIGHDRAASSARSTRSWGYEGWWG